MRVSNPARTKIEYVIYGLVILAVAIYGFHVYSTLFRDDTNERRGLIAIYQKVHLGDDKEAVERIIYQKSAASWRVSEGTDYLTVKTPMKFGASNWNVYIFFKENKAAAVIIRNSDTLKMQPPNAPSDKGDYRQFFK